MIILTKKKLDNLVSDIRKSFELTIEKRYQDLWKEIKHINYSLLEDGNEKIIEKRNENDNSKKRKSKRNKKTFR